MPCVDSSPNLQSWYSVWLHRTLDYGLSVCLRCWVYYHKLYKQFSFLFLWRFLSLVQLQWSMKTIWNICLTSNVDHLILCGWNLRTNLSILAHCLDLCEYITSNGLCSVTNSNSMQNRYAWNRSHAQTSPKASFSVYEYLRSTSVSDRLANAVILGSPICIWTNTAPNPTGLASAMTSVRALGL